MKTAKTFALSHEECLLVLDHISGLVVIDHKGRVRHLSPDMRERLSRIGDISHEDTYLGLDVESIHPLTKIKSALGGKEEITLYITSGKPNIARQKPLYKDGRLVGAFDHDLVLGTAELKEFLDKLLAYAYSSGTSVLAHVEMLLNRVSAPPRKKYVISDIIGKSEAVKKLKQQIYNIAMIDSTVLITGETGSGKELIAQSVHYLSRRGGEKLVEVNCAAIPESLVEAELFGYEEGSFTGARKGGFAGRFEMADQGTIFLDEIDHLPYHIQPKLLRVLQEKEVDRIGAEPVPVDVRVIAATNKNLKELVKKGLFREDLYYRLDVMNVQAPSLRERKEDIPLLTRAFVSRFNESSGRHIKDVTQKVYERFNKYHWPGNVRELFNVLERSLNLCKGEVLGVEALRGVFLEAGSPVGPESPLRTLEQTRNEAEKAAIEEALKASANNISRAARLLGVTRANLYYKMKKHGLRENA